ncbi:MAG: transposase [Crocinitomicaceae bacterium]|nr:transposase [Crocinitomicaceae bacterium]
MIRERRTYDKTFKIKAVELSVARNSVKDVAEELDIPAQLLSVWRKQYRENKDTFSNLTADLTELIVGFRYEKSKHHWSW